MRNIPVPVVDALYELHQTIGRAEKNYVQSKQYNKMVQVSLRNGGSPRGLMVVTVNILNFKINHYMV
jgi:hypothetical protein